MMHKLKLFALLLTGVFIAGCSGKHPIDNLFDDYNSELARFAKINLDSLEITPIELKKYPQRRNVRLPIVERRIDLADFITFKKCNLQELIALRNNAMGKTMFPSQQFIYEVEFISRASECLEDLEDPDLKEQVLEIVSLKKQDLNKVFWNSTFGSAEFENLFSLNASGYKIDFDKSEINELISAINSLVEIYNNVESNSYKFDPKNFEKQFSLIESSEPAGKVLRSALLIINNLKYSNKILETLLQTDTGDISEYKLRSNYLKEVFHQNYIERLQTYVSTVLPLVSDFSNSIRKLYEAVKVDHKYQFNNFYKQFILNDENSIEQLLKQSIVTHTKLWKTVDEKFEVNIIERK
jgi:hypothetical protein